MLRPPMRSRALLLAALGVTVAACSDGNGPSSSSDLLTQSQAAELSVEATGDLDELADFSSFDASTGLVVTAPGAGAGARTALAPACVNISPSQPVNSDGDAIPDSVRFDYGDCAFTRGNGLVTDSLSGTIDFIDPLPNLASLGVRSVLTDFTRKRDNTAFPLRSFTAVHNGTREWGGNADTLGHTITGFSTVWTHPSGRTTIHTKDWVAKFTATIPGTISLITPLPAGSFTVSGTGTWTTLGQTWSVVTSTGVPLLYDPTCLVAPRFTDGILNLVVTRNTQVTDVVIEFTSCGQYTVTHVRWGYGPLPTSRFPLRLALRRHPLQGSSRASPQGLGRESVFGLPRRSGALGHDAERAPGARRRPSSTEPPHGVGPALYIPARPSSPLQTFILECT
jgi:hypothetical protein